MNNQTESEKGIEWYISAPSFLNSCEWLLLYGHSIQKLHSFKVINYRETIFHTCPLYFSGRSHILYVQNWGHHISFISCGLKRGSAFLRWQTFLTFDSNNSVWWFNQNMDINHFCSLLFIFSIMLTTCVMSQTRYRQTYVKSLSHTKQEVSDSKIYSSLFSLRSFMTKKNAMLLPFSGHPQWKVTPCFKGKFCWQRFFLKKILWHNLLFSTIHLAALSS